MTDLYFALAFFALYLFLLLFNCQGSILYTLKTRACLLYHFLPSLSIPFSKFLLNFFRLGFQKCAALFGANFVIIPHLDSLVNRFLKSFLKKFCLFLRFSLPRYYQACLRDSLVILPLFTPLVKGFLKVFYFYLKCHNTPRFIAICCLFYPYAIQRSSKLFLLLYIGCSFCVLIKQKYKLYLVQNAIFIIKIAIYVFFIPKNVLNCIKKCLIMCLEHFALR